MFCFVVLCCVMMAEYGPTFVHGREFCKIAPPGFSFLLLFLFFGSLFFIANLLENEINKLKGTAVSRTRGSESL